MSIRRKRRDVCGMAKRIGCDWKAQKGWKTGLRARLRDAEDDYNRAIDIYNRYVIEGDQREATYWAGRIQDAAHRIDNIWAYYAGQGVA